MKRAVSSLLFVACAGATYAIQPPSPEVRTFTGPSEWVPFSATLTRVFDPGTVSVGRFCRGADGSTRAETGASLADIDAIGIKNISEGVFYLWNRAHAWESHPLDLPPSGWRPPLRKTVTVAPDQIEGYALTKGATDRYGSTIYEAPQLNFFALRITSACRNGIAAGCSLSFSNIVVGEQPPDLFKPPAGEPIIQRSEPGGIVRHRTR